MARATTAPAHWPKALLHEARAAGCGLDESEPLGAPSVIIDDLDLVSVAVLELKANPPWSVDRDRPLPLPVALERMQPDALERADVQTLGCVQGGQQLQR